MAITPHIPKLVPAGKSFSAILNNASARAEVTLTLSVAGQDRALTLRDSAGRLLAQPLSVPSFASRTVHVEGWGSGSQGESLVLTATTASGSKPATALLVETVTAPE